MSLFRFLTLVAIMSCSACVAEKAQDTGAMNPTESQLNFAPDSVFGLFNTYAKHKLLFGIWQLSAVESDTPQGEVRLQLMILEEYGGPTETGTYDLAEVPTGGLVLGLQTGCREVELGEERCAHEFIAVPTGSVTFVEVGSAKGASLVGTLQDITFVQLDVQGMEESSLEELESQEPSDWILDRDNGGQEFTLDTWRFDLVLG